MVLKKNINVKNENKTNFENNSNSDNNLNNSNTVKNIAGFLFYNVLRLILQKI